MKASQTASRRSKPPRRQPEAQAPLQVLIPLAGHSPFFDAAEHFFPKPLTEFGGMTMIERVIRPLRAAWPDARFVFVVNKDDVVRFSLDATLHLLAGEGAKVIPLGAGTQGALCSCLMSIDA